VDPEILQTAYAVSYTTNLAAGRCEVQSIGKMQNLENWRWNFSKTVYNLTNQVFWIMASHWYVENHL